MVSKHFDYYIASAEVRAETEALYEKEVGNKRTELLTKLFDETGAIAFSESNTWGSTNTLIGRLGFPLDHPLVGAEYMVKPIFNEFEGEKIALLRGKCNRREGNAFNKKVNLVNNELKKAPTWCDWLVDHFGIMRTGMGESTGRGVAMLETKAGTLAQGLGFKIPNSTGERHGTVAIPECFVKVTRGQWLDLTETE